MPLLRAKLHTVGKLKKKKTVGKFPRAGRARVVPVSLLGEPRKERNTPRAHACTHDTPRAYPRSSGASGPHIYLSSQTLACRLSSSERGPGDRTTLENMTGLPLGSRGKIHPVPLVLLCRPAVRTGPHRDDASDGRRRSTPPHLLSGMSETIHRHATYPSPAPAASDLTAMKLYPVDPHVSVVGYVECTEVVVDIYRSREVTNTLR